MKTVGVVGLGLIGGSFAKAYHADGGWKVLAHDRDESILGIAELGGEIDGRLTKENIGNCDLILIPGDTHCYDHHLDQVLDAVRDWMRPRA